MTLTTGTATYSLRKAETTNTLLVLQPDASDDAPPAKKLRRHVVTSLNHTYELSQTLPRIYKLRKLLTDSSYSGDLDETIDTTQMYTFSDLLDHVQASAQELREALATIGAFELNGTSSSHICMCFS